MTPLVAHQLDELHGYFDGHVRVLKDGDEWVLLWLTPSGCEPVRTCDEFIALLEQQPLAGTNLERELITTLSEPFMLMLNPAVPDSQGGSVQ